MTTYTDKLTEAMARAICPAAWTQLDWQNQHYRVPALPQDFDPTRDSLKEARAALIAQLKFMIEHGPSEGQVKEALAEADRHGYYATMEYFGLDEAIYTFTAMCRALLAELEGSWIKKA